MKKLNNWLLKKLRNWLFSEELIKVKLLLAGAMIEVSKNNIRIKSLEDEREALIEKVGKCAIRYMEEELGGVSVDVHPGHYSPSWAVISIQGQKADYVNFINLGDSKIREIQHFLSRFDKEKVNLDLPNGMPKRMFI